MCVNAWAGACERTVAPPGLARMSYLPEENGWRLGVGDQEAGRQGRLDARLRRRQVADERRRERDFGNEGRRRRGRLRRQQAAGAIRHRVCEIVPVLCRAQQLQHQDQARAPYQQPGQAAGALGRKSGGGRHRVGYPFAGILASAVALLQQCCDNNSGE